jgi:hypothetical protein
VEQEEILEPKVKPYITFEDIKKDLDDHPTVSKKE